MNNDKCESISDKIALVDQFVEATFFEKQTLMKQFNDICSWRSTQMGLGAQIGGNNTYVIFWFEYINGKLVAFYETTSSVVHWEDVDDFIRSKGKPYTTAANYYPMK